MGQILAVIDRLDPRPGRSQRRGHIAFMLGHVFRALPFGQPVAERRAVKVGGHVAHAIVRGRFLPVDLRGLDRLARIPPVIGDDRHRAGQAMHRITPRIALIWSSLRMVPTVSPRRGACWTAAWTMPSTLVSIAYFALPVDFT
jgi:hypothetical protein